MTSQSPAPKKTGFVFLALTVVGVAANFGDAFGLYWDVRGWIGTWLGTGGPLTDVILILVGALAVAIILLLNVRRQLAAAAPASEEQLNAVRKAYLDNIVADLKERMKTRSIVSILFRRL